MVFVGLRGEILCGAFDVDPEIEDLLPHKSVIYAVAAACDRRQRLTSVDDEVEVFLDVKRLGVADEILKSDGLTSHVRTVLDLNLFVEGFRDCVLGKEVFARRLIVVRECSV